MSESSSSTATLLALLDRVKADDALSRQFASATTLGALVDLVAQQGVHVTSEELFAFVRDEALVQFNQDLGAEEITDEQLSAVAGGASFEPEMKLEPNWA